MGCRLVGSVVGASRLWSTGSIVVACRLSCSVNFMWDLLGSGIKPMSLALACAFFTTEPPGKPPDSNYFKEYG